jgi:glucokinase
MIGRNDTVLAIDIGGSKLATGLVRGDGAVLCKEKTSWGALDAESVVETVLNTAKRILDADTGVRPVCAGVNIPGLADIDAGLWIEACFSGIRNVPIAAILSEELGMLAFIDNDVNNCALAEKRFGVCKNETDFIWLTVSNGCGGAVFIEDHIYRGINGFSGELGHICVEEEGGYPCGCGNCGCLEAQAAGPGISRRYRDAGGGEASAKEIALRAEKGDALALRIYEKEGYYIGKALAAAINTLNPQKAVVGGGVSGAFELFYPSLMDTVRATTYREASKNVTVEKTGLGYDAALIGAAALAMLRSGNTDAREA